MDLLTEILRQYGALGAVIALVIANLAAAFWLFANGTLEMSSRRRAAEDFYREQIRITKEGYEARLSEVRQDLTDMQADRDQWRERAWKAITAGQTIVKGQTPPEGIHRSETGG